MIDEQLMSKIKNIIDDNHNSFYEFVDSKEAARQILELPEISEALKRYRLMQLCNCCIGK